MRPLAYAAAAACENATHPRCRCRCGGALHGAKRGRVEELPADDPHHAEPPAVDPHHAEPPAVDPQTSLFEALDISNVLARLELVGARRRGELVQELEPELEGEELERELEALRRFVECSP